jgi:chromate transporter
VYYRTLGELAVYFLRLGATAFGGPAAHIALMEEDCVRRRRWISQQQFLDVLGASNMIPGPTSTELAMHIGHVRAGWMGLLVAGVCFIAPAALIVAAIAALYVRAGELPAAEGLLRMVKPVVVAVIIVALVPLARAGVGTALRAFIAAAAALLVLLGANEVIALLLAGLVHLAITLAPRQRTLVVVPLADVFVYFVKAGSAVLGSGYVLLPILRGDLVARMGWLSEAQLLDAIAVGQVTPGPLFTTATFIGYLLGGVSGAVVATAGMFLPAFLFSAASVRMLDRWRASPAARAFLDGVNAAAVALIAVVLVWLASAAIVDRMTALVAVASLVLIAVLRVNAATVIVAAAALGMVLQW